MITSFNFSASSLATSFLAVLGVLSTNFFAYMDKSTIKQLNILGKMLGNLKFKIKITCTRLQFGNMVFNSFMRAIFCLASKPVNLTVNAVCTIWGSCSSSS